MPDRPRRGCARTRSNRGSQAPGAGTLHPGPSDRPRLSRFDPRSRRTSLETLTSVNQESGSVDACTEVWAGNRLWHVRCESMAGDSPRQWEGRIGLGTGAHHFHTEWPAVMRIGRAEMMRHAEPVRRSRIRQLATASETLSASCSRVALQHLAGATAGGLAARTYASDR